MHATIYSLGPIIIYKINVFWTRIAVQTYVHQAYTRKNKGKRTEEKERQEGEKATGKCGRETQVRRRAGRVPCSFISRKSCCPHRGSKGG